MESQLEQIFRMAEFNKIRSERDKLKLQNKMLVQELKNCVVVMERCQNILINRDGGTWHMLDTNKAQEAIKQSET